MFFGRIVPCCRVTATLPHHSRMNGGGLSYTLTSRLLFQRVPDEPHRCEQDVEGPARRASRHALRRDRDGPRGRRARDPTAPLHHPRHSARRHADGARRRGRRDGNHPQPARGRRDRGDRVEDQYLRRGQGRDDPRRVDAAAQGAEHHGVADAGDRRIGEAAVAHHTDAGGAYEVSAKDRFSPFEFALVICTAFGWYILGSVYSLVVGLTRTAAEYSGQTAYGDSHLLGVVLYESLIAPALLAVLYARGWRVADFRL